jgi:hypothetical protein
MDRFFDRAPNIEIALHTILVGMEDDGESYL